VRRSVGAIAPVDEVARVVGTPPLALRAVQAQHRDHPTLDVELHGHVTTHPRGFKRGPHRQRRRTTSSRPCTEASRHVRVAIGSKVRPVFHHHCRQLNVGGSASWRSEIRHTPPRVPMATATTRERERERERKREEGEAEQNTRLRHEKINTLVHHLDGGGGGGGGSGGSRHSRHD
jgi:hypothetical protein